MTNKRLKQILAECGFTQEDFAQEVGVNSKTVERWITTGRPPHPRYRQKAATILNENELDLWPDAVLKARSSGRDATTVYSHRSDVEGGLWDRLLNEATAYVDILVYAGMFVINKANLVDVLTEKAKSGARIRLLYGDRECWAVRQMALDEGIEEYIVPAEIDHALACVGRLANVPGIEIRIHNTTLYNSIYRFDDQILVNPHVYGKVAAHAPVIHLRRLDNENLFTMYTDSFDAVWNNAKTYIRKAE